MDFTQRPNSQQPQPKNWLVESILATIICCMPFGIAGIVFAIQVNKLYNDGDYEGAVQASNNAAKWTKISFWVGIAVVIISLAFVFLFGGMAILSQRNSNY